MDEETEELKSTTTFDLKNALESSTNFLPEIGNSAESGVPRYAQPSVSAMLPQYPHVTTQKNSRSLFNLWFFVDCKASCYLE
mmetsp:Transcript_25772/g.33779  ORF Transcript_25772/g.33779 Transcript_25772/m.33779 type:complete len:82 (+) Transcript_25772:35-280(+)